VLVTAKAWGIQVLKTSFCKTTSEIMGVIRTIQPSKSGWGRAHCPVCATRMGSEGSSKSFVAHLGLGYWQCFRCHAYGKFPKDDRFEVEPREAKKEPFKAVDAPEGYVPLWCEPGISSRVLRPARDYLARRGIRPHVIEEARIGAAAIGPAAGRVIVPLLDEQSRWIGWSARLWFGPMPRSWDPKYLTGPGTERDTVIWNGKALLEETWKPLLLVEGVFDALPYWPHAAAFLGKPAEAQILSLLKAKRPVIVALDGDAWLEAEMLALRLELEAWSRGLELNVAWLHLPPKRDPGNFDICTLKPNTIVPTCNTERFNLEIAA
jgi:hypothetical protein